MMITTSTPRVSILEGVEYFEGLEAGYGDVIVVDNLSYVNLQKKGYNSNDPRLEGSGYTRALKLPALINVLNKIGGE